MKEIEDKKRKLGKGGILIDTVHTGLYTLPGHQWHINTNKDGQPTFDAPLAFHRQLLHMSLMMDTLCLVCLSTS